MTRYLIKYQTHYGIHCYETHQQAVTAINGHGEVVEMIEAEPVRRLLKAIREAAYLFSDAGTEEEIKQAMKELEGV